MAEYYPLLSRAVAGLPDSTPDSRRVIYDRARAALIGQLKAVQPPIAEADIARESRMLDEAIERIETELASGGLPPAEARPMPPPPAARRPDMPLPAGNGMRPLPPRPTLPPRPSLPPRPGATGERPGLGDLEAARARLASLAKTGTPAPQVPRPLPVPPLGPVPVPPPPSARPTAPAPVSVPRELPRPELPRELPQGEPVARGDRSPLTEADIAVSRISPEGRAETRGERRDADAKMNVTLRKYGPRAEAAGVSADLDPAADDRPEDETAAMRGAVRPSAPLPPKDKVRNFRPVLIGLPIAAVLAGIAVFAYLRRDNPDDLARLRPAQGVEAPADQAGKIVERIGGGQAGRADAPAQTQPGTAPGAAAQSSANQANPAVPATARAALLVDAPEEAARVRTYVGNVVWRLDNVSRGPGQPLAIGVRAEIDLPDAKLRAIVLLQKNTDDTLPASHTIEVRFMPTEGGPIPGVAQISTPQMRKEDTPSGDALTGVPAQILRNFFLVGLTRGDNATTRNVDLIRTRGWIDIPMLLSDQRIAKITFEKGANGERVINEALEAWK